MQEARHGLLVAYAAAFFLQIGFVLLLGAVLALVVTPREGVSPLLGRSLQALALVLLPLGLLLSALGAWRGGKDRAFSAAMMLGGILAAPAWFALLLVMAGSDGGYTLRLALLLLVYFPLGALAAAACARFAVRPPGKPG